MVNEFLETSRTLSAYRNKESLEYSMKALRLAPKFEKARKWLQALTLQKEISRKRRLFKEKRIKSLLKETVNILASD